MTEIQATEMIYQIENMKNVLIAILTFQVFWIGWQIFRRGGG